MKHQARPNTLGEDILSTTLFLSGLTGFFAVLFWLGPDGFAPGFGVFVLSWGIASEITLRGHRALRKKSEEPGLSLPQAARAAPCPSLGPLPTRKPAPGGSPYRTLPSGKDAPTRVWLEYAKWGQTIEELRRLAVTSPSPYDRACYFVLYELAQGRCLHCVASVAGQELPILLSWVHLYNTRGPKALLEEWMASAPRSFVSVP